LQFQRDFTQAKSTELRALCDYNLALARLEKIEGTSLQTRQIEISE
jgi:outer membrane protein TolC